MSEASSPPEPVALPLDKRVEALLASTPPPGADALRAALTELLEGYIVQQRQFDRMMRISDRFQAAEREIARSMSERTAKQQRHLDKITRLSDRYQKMLRELNQALSEASTHDILTGLGNRRRMMEKLKESQATMERTGSPFCVALLDLDDFKKVNDGFGHEMGDLVLVKVARTLETSIREVDACGRWGGEEFVIVLPNTTLAAAVDVLERLRSAIALRDMGSEHQAMRVTVSLGLAQGRLGEPFSKAIKRADQALYRAKNGGRNRLEVEGG